MVSGGLNAREIGESRARWSGVRRWKEEDRIEREAAEKHRRGTRWADDAMEVDEDIGDGLSEESEDDEVVTAEVKALKVIISLFEILQNLTNKIIPQARRRYLRTLMQASKHGVISSSPPSRRHRLRVQRNKRTTHAALNIVAGYTVLVDTNILLSSLSMLTSVIESFRWTIIVPVQPLVITIALQLVRTSETCSWLGHIVSWQQ